MDYTEITFQGEYIAKRENKIFKNSLISSAFTSWQLLQAKGLKVTYDKYLKDLGLAEKVKYSKDYLKKEAEQTLENVEKMLKKAGRING